MNSLKNESIKLSRLKFHVDNITSIPKRAEDQYVLNINLLVKGKRIEGLEWNILDVLKKI